MRQVGKSKTSKLQKKCDALLTPIVKKLHPHCEVCGAETTVAHHWVEKSRSSNLRYDLRNLIPMCQSCHYKIHNRNGTMIMTSHDIVDDIIQKRGKDWKELMDLEGRKIIKTDVKWYEDNLQRLNEILA